MPISTNLNQDPYNNDFDETKNFHAVLFKPSVSVQTRELNQLQSILQNQIERFGDNIFKRGTLISGVNFSYDNLVGYVKTKDVETDGVLFTPLEYDEFYVREESSNLVAKVIKTKEGYESTAPNTKTLYVKYVNSGTNSNTTAFTSGQALRVFAEDYSLGKTEIVNGSTGFSNNDTVVFVSRVAVNVTSSNAFSNGESITASDGSRGVIVNITTDSDGYKILQIKPYANDIANVSLTTSPWVFSNATTITGATSVAAGTIVDVYGSGATGTVETDGVGAVTDLEVMDGGSNYLYDPYVTLKATSAGSRNYTDLDIAAHNYYARVLSSAVANAVGTAYMMSVTDGVIYQKGYFIRSEAQSIIVSDYSPTPNGVSVVFTTTESIVDSNEDTSLLDNSLGEPNYNAPGADRLKLVPTLAVMNTDSASANADVFILTSFSEGLPYRQKQMTEYSVIGDEMAKRTHDASDNFVLDPFLVTTSSPSNATYEALQFSLVIDPGYGYVSGYRVENKHNYVVSVPKGMDVKTNNTFSMSLNYENYVRVKEVGGLFQFNTGDTVKLYDTAKTFISNTAAVEASNITPVGTQIGTARVRSLTLESGVVGTATAVYRAYLFDIQMNSSQNLKSVRSLYYDGTSYKGIADTVLETDATTGASITKLYGNNNKLLFSTGVPTLKNANQVTYQFRTVKQNATLANTGVFTISLALASDQTFPYSSSSTLSSSQLKDLYFVPVSNNLTAFTPATGTSAVVTTSNVVTGTGTSFLADFQAGDFVYIYANTTAYAVRKVVAVTNNTSMQLDSNSSFANTTTYAKRYFPKYVPVPFGDRSGLSANVDGSSDVLTGTFGMTFEGATSTTCVVGYNVKRTNASPGVKAATRDCVVRLNMSNNSANNTGPWCLGVADILRLKKVYVGTTSAVNSTTGTDVTNNFFIDHNHTVNYADLGFLYREPTARYTPSASDHLLVVFDVANTTSTGYYNYVSYATANTTRVREVDSTALESLGANIHSFEVPEIYSDVGGSFDLLNAMDFRPIVTSTANVTATLANATTNPPYTIAFGNTADPTNDLMFPVPDSVLTANIEYFCSNTFAVLLHKNGEVSTQPIGQPVKDAIVIDELLLPAYPALPVSLSNTMQTITSTRIANEHYSLKRQKGRTIRSVYTKNQAFISQHKRYAMKDIAALERRVQALEYYQRLSLLETEITSKVIPSSITPDVNRFKYGFFVDDFSSNTYSAVLNPEYAATVIDGYLYPLMDAVNIVHSIDSQATIGYEDFLIAEQGLATTPPVIAVDPPQPPPVYDGGGTVTSPPDDEPTAHVAGFYSNGGWMGWVGGDNQNISYDNEDGVYRYNGQRFRKDADGDYYLVE